jgi:hypothetical protein
MTHLLMGLFGAAPRQRARASRQWRPKLELLEDRAAPSAGVASLSHVGVALNPQPLPPGIVIALNPQPLPPGIYAPFCCTGQHFPGATSASVGVHSMNVIEPPDPC